jgi:hypothetical protein
MVIRTTADNKPRNRCVDTVFAFHLRERNPHTSTFCSQGSALTFFQMLFITLHTIPSFLIFQRGSWLPRLKPRQVPLSRWTTQVLLVVTSSLLNNWAHFYNVPLTILIVFRSAGKFFFSLNSKINASYKNHVYRPGYLNDVWISDFEKAVYLVTNS